MTLPVIKGQAGLTLGPTRHSDSEGNKKTWLEFLMGLEELRPKPTKYRFIGLSDKDKTARGMTNSDNRGLRTQLATGAGFARKFTRFAYDAKGRLTQLTDFENKSRRLPMMLLIARSC